MTATRELLALEAIGIKLGLEQIRELLERLSRPDRAFPSIIIAGTNGKGSVTAMVERGLRAAGMRTGRFTSPHLVDLEERFAISGAPISAATLDAAAARVLSAARSMTALPSFFEATTALALDVFQEARVDVAVLEVGLGGRLDATNAVEAAAVAITSVDFDHEQYLGDTLEAIAREKAGVIKPGSFVVVGRNPPEVMGIMEETARREGARLIRACDGVSVDLRMDDGHAAGRLTTPVTTYEQVRFSLAGRHQIDNGLTSIRLLEELASTGTMNISAVAIRTAIEDVEWPARLERLSIGGVDVLLDGAHNPAGATALASFLAETYGRRLPLVVGAMRDKNLSALLSALVPAAACFVFTSASSPRAAAPMELLAIATRAAPGMSLLTRDAPLDAIREAAAFGAPVVVAGSLYLAGEVRAGRS